MEKIKRYSAIWMNKASSGIKIMIVAFSHGTAMDLVDNSNDSDDFLHALAKSLGFVMTRWQEYRM